MSFTYVESTTNQAKIKVIGVGGAGGNAINNMIEENLRGVNFIVANTDAQALEVSKASVKIQIGSELTEGLGAGANPNIGRDAAVESADELRDALSDSHMVFITAGFGGGTGTGAAPVIAEIAKELGALTVAVVSRPFSFEGKKRSRQAEEGLKQLKDVADTVIIIPNDRLRGIAPKNAKMVEMFRKADEVLHHSVKGITDLIMRPGLVNLDFADVKTTMSQAGMALMGIGIATGENRAIEAAERAISHPLLEDISISGARAVLMNITSSSELTMDEMTEACDRIYEEVGDDAEIIWGQAIDEELGDEMRVTVIATGIGGKPDESISSQPLHRVVPQPMGRVQPRVVPSKKIFSGDRKKKETPTRGVVRPMTEEEIKSGYLDVDELESPTFVRMQGAAGEGSGGFYRGHQVVVDGTDLDVPTFLRRKAD
ncbi:MAG: cell division protein FtsZ [Deltaproteobacteria bacterium]|nr:MAG: cell division protein FtsZ [Deltaproteobacteria bacterium]